jgi:hypothetical protein
MPRKRPSRVGTTQQPGPKKIIGGFRLSVSNGSFGTSPLSRTCLSGAPQPTATPPCGCRALRTQHPRSGLDQVPTPRAATTSGKLISGSRFNAPKKGAFETPAHTPLDQPARRLTSRPCSSGATGPPGWARKRNSRRPRARLAGVESETRGVRAWGGGRARSGGCRPPGRARPRPCRRTWPHGVPRRGVRSARPPTARRRRHRRRR